MASLIALGTLAGWLYIKPVHGTLDQELSYRVDELAGPDKPVKNVVLRVEKGDGSFAWAGAAGTANQDTQTAMTADTPIYIASVTKLFTAAAIMRFSEQGALSLDDTIDRYLPEDLIQGIDVYQGSDYTHELTIRELLSQTSGLPDYYDDKANDGTSLFEAFMADPDRTWTVDELIARARDQMSPHFAPGTAAYYSDTNYQLLGKIIESVSGKPLQTVFEQLFFEPLGMQHTWLVGLSQPQAMSPQPVADVFYNDVNITRIRSNGAYWADGGIVSTTQDMIAFLKALNGGEIISQTSLQSMHDWRPLQNLPFQYGYGTMSLPRPINTVLRVGPIWGHSGSDGSSCTTQTIWTCTWRARSIKQKITWRRLC